MASAAVGASVAISATSLVWYANWTNHVVRQDRLAAEAFAPGSLLIMWGEYWFVRAKSNGVNLASLGSNTTEELQAMEATWRREGRCVYIETTGDDVDLLQALGGTWEPFILRDGFELLLRADSPPRCRP